ncbi:MAG: hypothetical protein JWM55_667 [Acidimicrobiaceae bacterium]|nr:hypothetical protein [Acidimicrobiaceae bacterium]
MTANINLEERNLIEQAVTWFQVNLPPTWKAEATSQTVISPGPSQTSRVVDALLTISTPQGGGTNFLVEAKPTFAPRDAERFLTGMARQLRLLNPSYPILVVTPWLSERSQEVLTAEDINYLDLTGNVRIALNHPSIFIYSKGAPRNPTPSPRAAARLKGPKAGRLARFLIDVTPPYGVGQIAQITGLAAGYISRLLTSLDEDALIERSGRGQVDSVDITSLLRLWTQTYDVFKSNQTSSYVAAQGPEDALDRLSSLTQETFPVIVTGSFSAVRFAPVAAPSFLLLYCSEPSTLAKELGLLPADRGSNVALLRPFDEVVWERTTYEEGVRYAAVAQTAADCLTGNGRMPAEGEALAKWMEGNQFQWRLPSVTDLQSDTRTAN